MKSREFEPYYYDQVSSGFFHVTDAREHLLRNKESIFEPLLYTSLLFA